MKKWIVFIFIAVFHISGLLAHQKMYQLVDLGLLDYTASEATHINNKGQVCGICEKDEKYFIFVWNSENKLKTMNCQTLAKPIINNEGIVFGSWIKRANDGRWEFNQESVFQWQNPFSSSTLFNFKDLGYPSGQQNKPFGIDFVRNVVWDANDHNQLVIMNQSNFDTVTKFSINSKSYITWVYDNGSFNKISNDQFKVGFKINNNSQVLGCQYTEEFVGISKFEREKKTKVAVYNLKDGTTRILPFPAESFGTDINDKGQIVGIFYNNVENQFQGFFGDPASDLVILNKLHPIACNNNGQIVGKFLHARKKDKPALWNNGVLLDLANITDLTDDQGHTWESLDVLEDINDHGIIVGKGKYNGKVHGFLLMPLQ